MSHEQMAIQYKDMWEKTIEENKHLRQQNERLKGTRTENPTLRDQFAMAALAGLIATCKSSDGMVYAKDAYQMADAMLRER